MTATSTATEMAQSQAPWWRRPGTRWIALVVALLLGNVGMVTLLIVAAGPVSARRVLPDYYQRAANYDREIAQHTANRALGWNVQVAATQGQWRVAVVTPTGALRDAAVSLAISHRTKAQLDRTLVLRAGDGDGDGDAYAYVGELAMSPGIYDVEVAVTQGERRFVDRREVEVRP